MINTLKKLGIVLGVFAFALSTVNSASAALTLGALTAASDGALTITTAVGSAGNLFTTTTTGAINIGTAITTGVFTVGNAAATGNTVVNGTLETGTNSLYDNTTTANTTMFAGQTTGTIAIGGTAGTGAISIGTSTGAQTINIGTGNAVKTIVVGNATAGGASVTTIHAGTGGLNLGTTADARTINLGTGNAIQTIHIGDHATPVNVITIGGAASSVAITDAQWSITTAGVITTTGEAILTGEVNLGAVSTFTDSDATPDVSGAAYWNTNTTAVTITDFDGAGLSDGDIIVVVSKGAITYDVTTSGIICGTTDIITAASDVTTFIYDGTDWRCTARIDTSDDLN